MFCSKCGHPLAAAAAFCSACGAPTAAPAPAGRLDPVAFASVVVSLFAWLAYGLWLGSLGMFLGMLSLLRMRTEPALRGRAIAITGLLIGLAGIASASFGLWALYSDGVAPAERQQIEAPAYVPTPTPEPRYSEDGVRIRP